MMESPLDALLDDVSAHEAEGTLASLEMTFRATIASLREVHLLSGKKIPADIQRERGFTIPAGKP